MTQLNELYDIPHTEFRSIHRLVDAHDRTYGDLLRAVVVFGHVLTMGDTYDIDLLEVVEGWTGDRVAEFGGTAELPLRGKLRLYFLSPEEFAHPEMIDDPEMRDWVFQLLDRVKEGYLIVLQSPPLFADVALATGAGMPVRSAPGSGMIQMSDPLSPPKLHR